MPAQTVFEDCYRGRQSSLHHTAYMRTGKVFSILRMLERGGITLEDKDVFDYGFGAGTFFRYCPPSAHLFGVEIDPENVSAVNSMLKTRGHPIVDLQPIEIANWAEHPLLDRTYDLIVCSHVLEHLDDPAVLLRKLRDCLRSDGAIIALVPINERAIDPHHVRAVDAKAAQSWAAASNLTLADYLEGDPWFYWFQPLLAGTAAWKRAVAQAASLGIGACAVGLSPKRWPAASQVFQSITFSKPTQAGLRLTR